VIYESNIASLPSFGSSLQVCVRRVLASRLLADRKEAL
jgi:hypothetical protein